MGKIGKKRAVSSRRPLRGEEQKKIAGLTEHELATRAGVSRSTVQRWKRGTSNNKKLMAALTDTYKEILREKNKQLTDYHKDIGADDTVIQKKAQTLLGMTNITDESFIEQAEKITSSKTFDVSGEKEWRQKVSDALGLENEDLDRALDVNKYLLKEIERLSGESTFVDFMRKKYGFDVYNYDSWQRVQLVKKLTFTKTGRRRNTTKVIQHLNEEYKKYKEQKNLKLKSRYNLNRR